jgi:hypothetical protein
MLIHDPAVVVRVSGLAESRIQDIHQQCDDRNDHHPSDQGERLLLTYSDISSKHLLKPNDGICVGVLPKKHDEIAEGSSPTLKLTQSTA